MSLKIDLSYIPVLSDGTQLLVPQYTAEIPIGPKGVHYNFDIALSDVVIAIGSVSEIGQVRIVNHAEKVLVTTPSAPVVDPQGTPGAATWDYKIVAYQADGT